jgi:4-methyl-5(b-hydroxyethyl)-thiazole monophosphate biosynthesis
MNLMIARAIALTTLLTRTATHVPSFTPILHQPVLSRSIVQQVRLPIPTIPSNTAISMSTAAATTDTKKKRVLVPIADDSEEIETSSITDVLTRFGSSVIVASVMPDLVCKMSRGLKICADVTIEEASKEEWDLIVLPGGMPGANHLRDSEFLVEMLKKQQKQNKLYGAICAAPAVVLQTHGLLAGPGATCYPAPPFRSTIADPSDDKVVVQGNVITSQGPGTSLLFALSLGEQLVS